jgi:predicted AlkP superfamily phosphohydrolase/phosphomutase
MNDKNSVFVIGLDGATFDLIKPWCEEGHLPTFKSLLENGVHGKLTSTIPPVTIPAWNSMLTGKNPGKLNLYSFFKRKSNTYKFIPFNLINKLKKDTIIDIISEKGMFVCTLNVPIHNIPYKIKGALVAGWFHVPGEHLTYPTELASKLDKITDGYEVDIVEVKTGNTNIKFKSILEGRDYLDSLNRISRKRTKATEYLLKEYDWDFAITVFTGPDRVQHKFWNKKNLILEFYRDLDSCIKKLLNGISKESTVLLVSDHGFGGAKITFLINTWLIKNGYLKLKKSKNEVKFRLLLKKLKLWKMVIKLRHLFPISVNKKLVGKFQLRPIDYEDEINWDATVAYSFEVCRSNYGLIRINLDGREPKGIVKKREYLQIRDNIIQNLRQLNYNGSKLTVHEREEIYQGENIVDAPDIVFYFKDEDIIASPRLGDDVFYSHGEHEMHKIDGLFLMKGPEIKKGVEINNVQIYDIVPTILHILDIPIDENIDGRVLTEIFECESDLFNRKVNYKKSRDLEKIKRKVKELKKFNKI